MSRARRGARAHQAGLAAEEAAARAYQRRGGAVLARRWRAPEGEIDLVVRLGEGLVFVEVKARAARPVDDPVGERQWRRLEAAAQRYMMLAETGATPLRFDLALVGPDGAIEIVENARMAG